VLRVALTGGIATGKSYARARFETRGIPTVDADVLAREVVAPGTPGLEAVVRQFGRDVLDMEGGLDRARLAGLVFADTTARRALEAIVHPRVQAAIEAFFEARSHGGATLAIADIPLLFETGRAGAFDVVLVAACSPEQQLTRLRARDHLTEEAARQRLAAQWPIAEKVLLADFVFDTGGTFAETDRQVDELVVELTTRAARA
jgi:dephospho-CoA kinase